MEKKVIATKTNRSLLAIANWVLAGVGIGSSYIAVSSAIDTGSLLMYAATLILFGLGVRHLTLAVKGLRGRPQ